MAVFVSVRTCCFRLACAGGAETDDREVGEASLITEQLFDLVADGVKLVRCERANGAAALT
jgi:hypothetical protein